MVAVEDPRSPRLRNRNGTGARECHSVQFEYMLEPAVSLDLPQATMRTAGPRKQDRPCVAGGQKHELCCQVERGNALQIASSSGARSRGP